MIMSENIALIVAIIVLMPYMVRHIICVSVMDFTISNTLGLSLITKDVYEEKKRKPKTSKITYDTVLLSQTTFLRFYAQVQNLMQRTRLLIYNQLNFVFIFLINPPFIVVTPMSLL